MLDQSTHSKYICKIYFRDLVYLIYLLLNVQPSYMLYVGFLQVINNLLILLIVLLHRNVQGNLYLFPIVYNLLLSFYFPFFYFILISTTLIILKYTFIPSHITFRVICYPRCEEIGVLFTC